jgi:DNA cross-link repair 1A protein
VVDANHCPGSVMVLFRLPSGVHHLHTGDFRYSPSVADHVRCAEIEIHNLYLDTTYSDPQYVFPPQREVCLELFFIISIFINVLHRFLPDYANFMTDLLFIYLFISPLSISFISFFTRYDFLAFC